MRHRCRLGLAFTLGIALLWSASARTAETGLGVPFAIGQPGNLRYNTTVAMTVMLEKVNSPLVAVQWNNRIDQATGNVGYSTGNGGEISVRVRKVNSVSGGSLTVGTILGETEHVASPALQSSWNKHWQREGGKGTASASFRDFPTLRFKSPVNLGAAGLKVGDLIAFEFVQHNSSSGTVSINVNHAQPWSHGTLQAFSSAFREYGVYDEKKKRRKRKLAAILIGYQDGVIKGNTWFGLANSSFGDQLDLDGTNRIRQVIPVKVSGKKVKRIETMLLRTTFNTSSNLIIELREAGSNPGKAGDEGKLLYQGSISGSSVTEGTSSKHLKAKINALSVTPPSPIQLTSGKTYYLVARSSGPSTTFRIQKMHRALNHAEHGLKIPDFMYSGFRGQMDTGSGWKDILGGQGDGPRNDAPLWMEF